MNTFLKIFLIVSLLILFVSWLFPRYIIYCKKCGQSCSLFTDKKLGQCLKDCYCPNIAPRILPHTNDFSSFVKDLEICDSGYSDVPQIEKSEKFKTKISNLNKKPNIILFVVDDLDEMISPYWEAMPFSEKLFKQNGTHFINGFTSTSYCCPARCQIFSGLYPHNNGVLGMHGPYGSIHSFRTPHHLNGTRMKDEFGKCINGEDRTINLFLQKYAGYKTAIVGKYLNGIENEQTRHIDYVPVGWDEFHVGSDPYMYVGYRYTLTNWSSDNPGTNNSNVQYKWYSVNEEDYITDVMRNRSVEIIKKYKKNNKTDPLFMYVATSAPHLPLTPPERHRDKLQYWRSKYDEYVSSRPNYNYFSELETDWFKLDDRRIRSNKEGFIWNRLEWEKRMSSLYAVDELIKSVYEELDKLNELDNTIFGFVSDNGYNLGSHGIYNKMAAYEESIRIPYYLSGPGFKKNHIDKNLVGLIDLAPTFLNIADLKIPEYIDGLSLLDTKARNAMLFQFKNNIDFVDHDHVDFSPELNFVRSVLPYWATFDFHPWIAVRTNEYKLIEYNVNGQYKEYEMFDIINDLNEMSNIYNNTTFVNIKNELMSKLSNLSKCSGQKCLNYN